MEALFLHNYLTVGVEEWIVGKRGVQKAWMKGDQEKRSITSNQELFPEGLGFYLDEKKEKRD